MRRDHVSLYSPAMGHDRDVIAYGHHGRPVLVFPSQQGRCWDYEERGMVEAVRWLIDDGRLKMYCVDSFDGESWHNDGLPLEERAKRGELYEDWIVNQVVPWIHEDCGGGPARRDDGLGGPAEIAVTGCSFGAYHSANLALKHADLFPLAICQSGVYDVSVVGWGEKGDGVYFNNPAAYVPNLSGDHLHWLRSRVSLVLVCGQGQWEDTTGALESTKSFAGALASKGLQHEVDLWGYDVPHDWPSWRNQLAHHLPRFC